MYKSDLRVRLQFFHTPNYPQTALFFSASSTLQRNNNRSGANHVRTLFTVHVGLVCFNRWLGLLGYGSALLCLTLTSLRSTTALMCCLNEKDCSMFTLPYLLASLYLMYAASSTWYNYVFYLLHCFVCLTVCAKNIEVRWDMRCTEFGRQDKPTENTTLILKKGSFCNVSMWVWIWFCLTRLKNKTKFKRIP